MNIKEILHEGTDALRHHIARIKLVRNSFNRKGAPLRGCFIKEKSIEAVEKIRKDLSNQVYNLIEKSNLNQEAKQHLLVWENFQFSQKGPTGPLTSKDYDEQVISGINVDDFDLSEEDKSILSSVAVDLFNYLKKRVRINLWEINFSDSWHLLPSNTLRGFPYAMKGIDCDDDIIKNGGTSANSAIKYAEKLSSFVCLGGYRIQGKPLSKGAKIRPVYITPVRSQYFDVGIVKESMEQLKSVPTFCGWVDKEERNSIIQNQEREVLSKFVRIQLDYSAYDKHIHPFIQNLISKYFEYVTTSGLDIIKRRNKLFSEWRLRQSIILPDKHNTPTIYPVPYQLPSGEIRTQHDGSLIGLVIMGYIYRKLYNLDINWDYVNQLGDDAVFPVPIAIFNRDGYEKVVKDISLTVSNIGFNINTSKSYPNSDVAFLQKLYVLKEDIIGVGSWTRSLSSFMYREKYPKRIKGIKNLWALELISQITILSEPYSTSVCNTNFIGDYIAKWWLLYDIKLRALISYYFNMNININELFKFLVKLTGLTFSQILDYLDLASYDHKGISTVLKEGVDYSKVFPILPAIVNNFNKNMLLGKESIERILNLRDSFADDSADDSFLVQEGDLI